VKTEGTTPEGGEAGKDNKKPWEKANATNGNGKQNNGSGSESPKVGRR
jgi:hypothetical protein